MKFGQLYIFMLIIYLWVTTVLMVFLFCIWTKKDFLNIFLKSVFFGVTILGVVNLFKFYN